ncbi:MAG TPA: tRNA (adenosine(37)-N6)-threonylcarbamoyltransferase complex ATPase subunit type 1 TsaE [Abditibacteriaceae bacterium]|nr:tRNA (adenosine(37)-N6)-threonylcarbamoyltransferase complex ATPase subunit type 1 TsaE [Abditibacteriaceae bacterium]
MNREQFFSHAAAETSDLGESISRRLRPGDLVTLSGPLGAGKTTLVQGVARGLGILTPATSPTFVLIIEHAGSIPLLHLDAYRLESKCFDAIRDAGVTDFLDRDDAVKLVEWPERIADFLPAPDLAITINFGTADSERTIEIVEFR